MLLHYLKSKRQHFCSPQDGSLSASISRCHCWVCWLGHRGRQTTPLSVIPRERTGALADLCCLGLVLLSETVSILGCIVCPSVLCQLDKYTLPSLPSLLAHCWGTRLALVMISVNKVERCGLELFLCSFVFLIFLTCAGAAGLLGHAQALITVVIKCLTVRRSAHC